MRKNNKDFTKLEKSIHDYAKLIGQPVPDLIEDVIAMLDEAYGEHSQTAQTGIRQDTV